MSDRQLRLLERQWKETDSEVSGLSFLEECLRQGKVLEAMDIARTLGPSGQIHSLGYEQLQLDARCTDLTFSNQHIYAFNWRNFLAEVRRMEDRFTEPEHAFLEHTNRPLGKIIAYNKNRNELVVGNHTGDVFTYTIRQRNPWLLHSGSTLFTVPDFRITDFLTSIECVGKKEVCISVNRYNGPKAPADLAHIMLLNYDGKVLATSQTVHDLTPRDCTVGRLAYDRINQKVFACAGDLWTGYVARFDMDLHLEKLFPLPENTTASDIAVGPDQQVYIAIHATSQEGEYSRHIAILDQDLTQIKEQSNPIDCYYEIAAIGFTHSGNLVMAIKPDSDSNSILYKAPIKRK